jgi:hypothetical protein
MPRTAASRIVMALAGTSTTFPRKRLVQNFTNRFRGNPRSHAAGVPRAACGAQLIWRSISVHGHPRGGSRYRFGGSSSKFAWAAFDAPERDLIADGTDPRDGGLGAGAWPAGGCRGSAAAGGAEVLDSSGPLTSTVRCSPQDPLNLLAAMAPAPTSPTSARNMATVSCRCAPRAPRSSWSHCPRRSAGPSIAPPQTAPADRSCSIAAAPGWTGTLPPAACGTSPSAGVRITRPHPHMLRRTLRYDDARCRG